jgi:MFS family permease
VSDLQSSSEDRSADHSRADEVLANEPRNLIVLALFNVTLRFSWIFKTESVLIPRFMDVIDGSGFVRGFLPILNRFGQSIPPLLLADRLRRAPLKQRVLQATSTLMGTCFLVLAGLWYWLGEPVNGGAPGWMPSAFLTIYVLFFFVSGMNQLALGTIQGKLIRANRRGRLLALSGVAGSLISITLAWFLLQRWLEPPLQLPGSGYVLIFGFAGAGFVLASLLTIPIREPADNECPSTARNAKQAVTDAWDIIRHDGVFRRAAVVAMLFITVQFLFPHFQAFGRGRIDKADEGYHLMLWVIAQNGAVGVFSWVFGVIADRYGNRLAIRIQVFLCMLSPVLALVLISDFFHEGHEWFWLAFVFLGLVPVTMKTFMNYTLELTDPASHPRYVSTMNLCFAVPFVLSPLVGMLIDVIGFEQIFVAISVTIGIAGLLTFRMAEPRRSNG